VEGPWQQLAPADVEHEGHARVGQPRPHGIEVDVRRGEVARRVRGDPQGGQAEPQGLLEGAARQLRVVQRQIPDGLETRVGCAGLGHRPVECRGAAVQELGILAPGEMAERKRREHELGVDAERIEDARSDLHVESARSHPALRPPQDAGVDLLMTV